MKKIILPALIFGSLLSLVPNQEVKAQIRNDRGTFTLPSKGDMLFETQANINLGGGSLFNLQDGFMNMMGDSLGSFPAIKMRYFANEHFAHRFALHIGFSSLSVEDVDDDATDLGLAVTYGMEKVFTAAERLNTYVGIDATIGFTSQSAGDDESVSTFGFGVKAFTGMDYYVLPKVYLGMELGYGLGFASMEESSTVSIAPYVTPTFRIGYILSQTRKSRGNGEPSYRSRERYDNDDDE